MSSSLHWRTPNPNGESFGYALKFPLRQRFGGYIGEWSSVGQGDVSYLQGLIDGAGEDSEVGREAAFLIEKIEKHGNVEIREVN